MRKITLSLLPILLFSLFLFPFSLNAQKHQLPDSSFETGWKNKTGSGGITYLEYETNYFYTLNSLHGMPERADLTAIRDGNAQHGNHCIQLKSGQVAVGTDYVFLPGMVGTISQDFVEQFLQSEGNISINKTWVYDTPHALQGWYKYTPVNSDSALIDIGFSNYGSEGFVAKKVISEAVNNWTFFTVPIPEQYVNQYFDEIRVLFVASANVNFDNLMQCKGQLGSTLWIDNIYLNYGNGIKQNLFSTLNAKAFPNPAAEILNVELNEFFAGKIMVFNALGSLVMEENVIGTQCQLNTSALATGNYIYKLMNDNIIFAQGKFVVAK